MSPALLDTGAPARNIPIQNPNPSGQLSSSPNLFDFSAISSNTYKMSHTMNTTSKAPDKASSGFSNSNETNPDFSFDSQSIPRSSSASVSAGLTKPRIYKTKRSLGSNHPRSSSSSTVSETWVDPGFNKFRFDSANLNSISSGSEMREKNEAYAFGGSLRDSNANLNSGSSGNVENDVLDDMRGLSIGDEEGIMNAKGSGFKFDMSSRTNMNVKEGLDRKGFAFKGSSRKKNSSFDESAVYDGMKKLNIGDLDTGVFLEKNIGTEVKLRANDTTRFGFGSGDNVASSAGKSVEAELQNEFKKLNVKDNPVVDLSGRMFNPSDNNKFLFKSSTKSSDSSLGSSGTALPDQMKNLNLKDSGNVNGNENNNVDSKTSEFVFGSTASSDILGVRTEKLLSDQLGNMKIESGSSSRLDGGFSSHGIFMGKTQTGNLGGKMFPNVGETITMASTFETVMPVKDASGRQVPSGRPYDEFQQNGSTSASSFSAAGDKFQFSGSTSEAPSMNIPERTSEFLFTKEQEGTGAPHVVFKTPNAKGNLFSSSNQKLDVNARRGATKTSRSKKGIGQLSRQRAPVQVWLGPNPVSGKSSSQENQGSPASYSPMDVSPYQETLADNHRSRETSVTSDDSYHLDNNDESSDLLPTVSNDAMDEDLASAAQRMNINDGDENCEEEEECSEYHFDKGDGAQVHPEESISGVETESFKSATEELDFDSDTFTSSEASLSSNIERQESDGRVQFCFPSSEDTGGSNFVFAASSSAQGQAAARQYRKKNWLKAGADSSNSPASENVPYATPHIHTVPFSGTSSLLSVGHNQSGDISLLGHDSEVNKKQEIKQVPSSTSVAAVAAQEACEKWRLRGNQSYANGDLSKAEDYYTRGVNSVSRSETSRSCLRALMLCYSNRAATRISLRRMREALEDCMLAAALDPSFLRVQLRAASCYLALGEIEEASLYFKKCLQSGADVVDRKILVEASDGLQKAQKVSECMKQSAELMRRRTSIDAESALGVIAEALIISPHSEKLLEMKAEALFMLRKYEEVIHLCEKSLDSAKINSPPLGGGGQAENSDTSVLSKSFSFKLWRFKLIFKSYFYLGKLEAALDLLEKQDGLRSGSSALDSTITLVVTVRELLRNKVAGNEAFQSGRHAEAIEHYTAALSCNVESRPFAAICFCNRAVAYKALGQITDAIADCSLAIALDKKYLKALSRRASLFEMIRDYGQASSDLQRLVSLLNKQVEEKTNQSGTSDRITSSANDLRQAQLRLSEVEEEARKEIPLNIYLILGIEPSVSASEIKKAYRKAALRHHPDKAVQSLARSDHGDDGVWKEIAEEVHKDADRLFKMIGEAYAILSNPSKRARYDLEEEIRTAQKKGNGSSASRSHADVQNYPFERSGSRRHWREVWKSYGHS